MKLINYIVSLALSQGVMWLRLGLELTAPLFPFYFSQLKVGSPKDAETNLGALISKEHLAKVILYMR